MSKEAKSMKVRFTLSIGFANAKREDVVEYDEELSEDELDQAWQEWASNYIDGGPHIIEE